MYAKLSFPTSALPAEIVRDITRVLTESNGSGGATVASCEFVTAADSSISDTEASTWELAEGSLGTGAVTANDRYIVRSSHTQTGKYKVAEIGCNGSASVFNNNTFSGATLMPILDYGEATQRLLGGYNSTSSTYLKNNTLVGTIHVVANSKCLLMFGDCQASYTLGSKRMNFIMESAVTTSSVYHDLAPYMFMSFGDVSNGFSVSYNDFKDITGPEAGTSNYATGGITIAGIDMWDSVNNTKVKCLQWELNQSYSSANDLWYRIRGMNENGTSLGLSVIHSGWFAGGGFGCSEIWPPYDGALNELDRRAIDSSGNGALPLYPLSIRDPLLYNEWLDYGATNLYKTHNGQGSYGDTISISGTDYLYIPLQTCGAFMVRLV